MKFFIALIILILSFNNLMAQGPCQGCDSIARGLFRSVKQDACNKIKTETDTLDIRRKRDREYNLVTDYTFRRKFANDFSKILIQENSFSNLNRHASLKIDENTSKVSFSPFIEYNGKTGFEPLKYFGSIEFSAETKDQIFKLVDKNGLNRSFQINLNLNFIPNFWNHGNFYVSQPQYDRFFSLRECARVKICEEYDDLLGKDSCKNAITFIDELGSLCDTSGFRKKMFDKFADAEEKLSKGYWRGDLKTWFSLSLTPYGYTENNGIDINTKKLEELNYYSPSAKAVINQLKTFICLNNSLYWNVWAQISRKNSFTGKTPLKWNHILTLSDTTFATSETKDAYNYDPANYSLQYLPSFGGQFIFIHSYKATGIGIDATFRFDQLPRIAASESNYSKRTITFGIVFPFNNKDGKRIINFEPFYSHSKFSNDKFPKEDFLGLKFSVPIFSSSN